MRFYLRKEIIEDENMDGGIDFVVPGNQTFLGTTRGFDRAYKADKIVRFAQNNKDPRVVV